MTSTIVSQPADVESHAEAIEVLHLVPALTIGGVEVGIARSYRNLNRRFPYGVFSLKGRGAVDVPLLSWRKALAWILGKPFQGHQSVSSTRRVIVSSLWPAHLLALCLRCLARIRCAQPFEWVVFLHSTEKLPGLKGWAIKQAIRLADRVLCDAVATRDGHGLQEDARSVVAPYVFDELRRVSAGEDCSDKEFDVIAIGRADPLKRFDLVATFLSCMANQKKSLRVAIIVAGDERPVSKVREFFADLDMSICWQINLASNQVADVMRNARSYLLLSDCEGFSLTTVEAVQAGCLPVVRPVGEICHYLSDAAAVWVNDVSQQGIEQAVIETVALLNDPEKMHKVCCKAQEDVQALGCYEDGFTKAVMGIEGGAAGLGKHANPGSPLSRG